MDSCSIWVVPHVSLWVAWFSPQFFEGLVAPYFKSHILKVVHSHLFLRYLFFLSLKIWQPIPSLGQYLIIMSLQLHNSLKPILFGHTQVCLRFGVPCHQAASGHRHLQLSHLLCCAELAAGTGVLRLAQGDTMDPGGKSEKSGGHCIFIPIRSYQFVF